MSQSPADRSPALRRAVAFSFLQKYLAFVIQMAVTVILARLLSPSETGIFSLAAAAVAIGHLMRDFGTAEYVISQKDVSRHQLRAAFTVTVLMAWGVAALLLALSRPLAHLYNEPGVAKVMQVMCLNFLLLPFGSVAFAMLSKQLQFGRILHAQTGAAILSGVVTVWAAWAGYSYMSLAAGSVVGNLWTIGYLLLVQPGTVFMRPTFSGLGKVLRFGGALTAARLIEQGANRSADFIVSGILGFHASGLTSKTGSLIGSFHEFFNSAVVRVATPAFAQTAHAPEQARRDYLSATLLVATALWLFFPWLAIYAHEIVLLMFGDQWMECVLLVQIAAVGALGWGPYMLSSSLLTSRGLVAPQVKMQIVMAPVTVATLVVGSLMGLVSLMVVFTVGQCLRFVLIERVMRTCCDLPLRDVMRVLAPAAWLALLAACAGTVCRWATTSAGWPPLLVLLTGLVATGLVALAAAARLQHPAYRELMRMLGPRLQQLRRRRSEDA